MEMKKVVCVTGASGFIGSWVVRELLDRGYTVHATVQHLDDENETNHLKEEDGSRNLLHLFEVDLLDFESLVAAINGTLGVFHIASPCIVDRVEDPQTQLLDPAIKGTINVLTAATQCGVNRVVVTSSISAITPSPNWPQNLLKQEDCWTDQEYCKLNQVTNIILGDREFWAGVKYTINITAPLVRVLRLCDSDDRPSMRYIYEAMDQAKEKIAKNVGGVLRRYKKIWEIIDERWNAQLHRSLHAAAYYLNPRFHFSDNFDANQEVMDGYYDVIERMVPLRTERRKIDTQLDKFKTSEGVFGRESAVDARTSKQPPLWWESFGNHCPELQRVAIRILSLVSSSTGCEWNWSTFEQLWYPLSKTMAEKAAWEYSKKNGLDVVVVNPGTVMGPILPPSVNASMLMLIRLVQGCREEYKDFYMGPVHVKDVALAHILLYENPEASGRHLCVEAIRHFSDFAAKAAELYPDYKVSSFPKDTQPGLLRSEDGSRKLIDLGLEFTSLEDIIKDSVESLKSKGYI